MCIYWWFIKQDCRYFPFLLSSTGLDIFPFVWNFLFIIICSQIEITELDEFAQAAFRGYKSLNRIQSRIFHTVYNTNENILVSCYFCLLCEYQTFPAKVCMICLNVISICLQVCAPTGAGKTNIAMISILHEVCQWLRIPGSLFLLAIILISYYLELSTDSHNWFYIMYELTSVVMSYDLGSATYIFCRRLMFWRIPPCKTKQGN